MVLRQNSQFLISRAPAWMLLLLGHTVQFGGAAFSAIDDLFLTPDPNTVDGCVSTAWKQEPKISKR